MSTKNAIQKLPHPYLSGEHPTWHKSDPDPGARKQAMYIKNKLTPREYIQLMTGAFGHDKVDLDYLKNILKNHPHNNERNNSEALSLLREHMAGDNPEDRPRFENRELPKNFVQDSTAKELAQHLMSQPLPKGDLHHIIDKPQLYSQSDDNIAESLEDQPNLDKEHLMKLAQYNIGNLLEHPNVDKDVAASILNDKNKIHKLNSRQIDALVDSRKDERPEKQLINQAQLEDLIYHSRKVSDGTVYKMINAIEPDKDLTGQPDHSKKKDIVDSLLGINGGEHSQPAYQFHLDDPDDADRFNYNNWTVGPHYSSAKAKILAGSKLLTPDQIDHIKRHGSIDEKYELFKNPHIDPKHAAEMYTHWLDDDQNKGYNLDELKQAIKDENSFDDNFDDYYQQGMDTAQENYPFSEYLRDHVSDRELMGGKGEYQWVQNYLAENNNWEHDTGKKDEDGDPIIEDYSGRHDMDQHPDYEARREEAQEAYDKELKHAKENPPDNLYDAYYEGLDHDSRSAAEDAYNEDMENAHEDPKFLPKHLPQMEEIHRQRREAAEVKARKKAAAEAAKDKEHLDAQVPNRTETHLYGDLQHHVEMAKQHADANGGSIDIGSLNKLYPNMKDKWKAIFGPKGKLTSQDLEQKWNEIPKTPYAISHRTWGTGLQNINQRPQTVFRLDHTTESLAPIKADPEVHKVFNKIADVSQRSGHPTNANTIAWSRVDTSDPNHWMIDEVQSDFASTARDYLNENGKKEEAGAVDKIIDYHKNWREALINHVLKMAKAHGVERVSTHSPESKAAHTGADKVHSVYKDSYGKVPRLMGFMPVGPEQLPLTEEGKKAFFTTRIGTSVDDLIRQHANAMHEHARQWSINNNLAESPVENPIDGELLEAHKQLAAHHAEKYKAHQQRLSQLDPTHELRKYKTPKSYNSYHDLPIINDEKDNAIGHAKGMVFNKDRPPIYGFDSALNQKPQMIEGHPGHQINLNPAAMKKSLHYVTELQKNELYLYKNCSKMSEIELKNTIVHIKELRKSCQF